MLQSPERTDRFTSQRLELAKNEWGDPEASPVILVHGGRDQKRSWDWVATRLACDYRVITYDLRGHGDSDRANDGHYGMMDHVLDLVSLVEHLDLEQVSLIGHSLGGNIALRFTGLYPDRVDRLVAIEGLGPSPKMLAERASIPIADQLRDWVSERRKRVNRLPRRLATLEEAKARMRAAFPQLSDVHIHHLSETGIRATEDGALRWAYDPSGMGFAPGGDLAPAQLHELWAAIACPTLLVYGRDSWASDPAADGRAAHFQAAQVVSLEGAGHWVHHDQFDAFMTQIEAFLRTPD